jgi:hypothetical protein
MRFSLPPKEHSRRVLVLLLGSLALVTLATAQSKRSASPSPLRVIGAGASSALRSMSVPTNASSVSCLSSAQIARMREAGTLKPDAQVNLCMAAPTSENTAESALRKTIQPAAAPTLQVEAVDNAAPAESIPGGGFSGFQLAPSYQATAAPFNYTTTMVTLSADFLKSGRKDIFTIDSKAMIHLLANKGDGTFAKPVSTDISVADSYYTGYISALVDDFNNDGYPDVIARDQTNSRIVFLRNNHDGTFAQAKVITLPSTYYAGAMLLGDVTGDGVKDLIVFRTTYSSSTTNTDMNIYVYAGDGSGDFSSTPIESDYEFSQALAIIPNRGALLGTNAGRPALYIEALSLNGYGINGATVFALGLNGDGTFQADPYTQQDFASDNLYINTYNSGLSLADLNGDGIPDLTMSFMDGYIYSALGQSDGSFPTVTVASPSFYITAQCWAITDIDGDGIPDFVVKDVTSLEVLPGLGTGKFGNASVYYAATSSSSGNSQNSPSFNMVVDDLDGDGVLDIAYVDASTNGFNRVSVFHGYGDGTYFASPTLPANSLLGYGAGRLYSQAVLDTNGDGYDDIVAMDTEGSGNYPYRTALSDGKGGFTFVKALEGTYGSYGLGYTLATADFNHDGRKDLVLDTYKAVASYSYNHTLAVALSNGDGTFQTPAILDLNGTVLTSSLSSVAVGDINGDGALDIVAVTTGGNYDAAAIITFLGNGDGTFQPATTQPFGNSYTYAGIKLADLNGDGKLDLFISDDGTAGSINPYAEVIFGDNSGKFDTSAATTIISGLSIRTIQIGDLNGDGHPDLAVFSAGQQSDYSVTTTDRGLIVYLNNGDGTFTRGNLYETGILPGKGLLTDVNGDGKLDVIYTVDYSWDLPAGDNAGSQLLLGSGDGTFGAPTNLALQPQVSLLAAGDLDGDGTTDLVTWSYYVGTTAVVRNVSGSTLDLTADTKSITVGDGVNLTVTVAPMVAHRPVPTGTVTFLSNGTSIGTAPLQAGSATFYADALPVGTNTITAVYSGDTAFSAAKGSSSVAISVTTAATVTPDFSLSGLSSSLNLTRGTTGTVSFSLAANATFSGSLTFSASNLPSGMSVTFSPASVTLAPNGSATATAVISTTSSTKASTQIAAAWLFAMPLLGSFLCFGGVRRGAARQLLLALAFAASFGALATVTGCGSSSPVRTAHTGDYTIVVKATPSVSGVEAKAFNVTVHVD